MSEDNIIPTRRVVTVNGSEFDNPSAFERHKRQTELGTALTKIKIVRADRPLARTPDPDLAE